ELAETTIRQHFTRLEDEELVERRSEAEGRGRPTAYFRLSSGAKQMYPSSDGEMLSELLDFLSREGYHRAIDDFFREFWEKRRRELEARLAEVDPESLRDFLDEQGFMPEMSVDEEGTIEIRECNCPLPGAVESTYLPCRLEADFLEQVVGRAFSRVEYIPEGNTACTYRFRATDEGGG
ncbi:MAG: helix-turn-helix transcriptional regulator, partial [Bradymonadaceae bacterium]